MKALIVYDSAYGNTSEIANHMAEAFGSPDTAEAVLVTDIDKVAASNADLLVVGSPTQGGRPTKPIQEFIESLPPGKSKQAAAFDTRFAIEDQKLGLRLLMKTIGYAAPKIASSLKEKGYELGNDPGGFIVNDKEGPLREGEKDRAAKWIVDVVKS